MISSKWSHDPCLATPKHSRAGTRLALRVPIDTKRTGEDGYVVTARLDGNFPGGTAQLKFRFNIAGDRIGRLEIAP